MATQLHYQERISTPISWRAVLQFDVLRKLSIWGRCRYEQLSNSRYEQELLAIFIFPSEHTAWSMAYVIHRNETCDLCAPSSSLQARRALEYGTHPLAHMCERHELSKTNMKKLLSRLDQMAQQFIHMNEKKKIPYGFGTRWAYVVCVRGVCSVLLFRENLRIYTTFTCLFLSGYDSRSPWTLLGRSFDF